MSVQIALAANDERGEWAEAREMNATYALLYNTLDVNGTFYLPTQMDESVWRLVYGPSVRSRDRCWSDALGTRIFTYSQRRRVGNNALQRFQFPPPQRAFDARTGRSFELQKIESYLCGMHAINNVANAIVMAPPDLLSSIELVRSFEDSKFASPEELTLAALREGIFLLPIKLVHASDLNPLDASETFPRNKCFLELLEKARGMLVFQPTPGSTKGHFVSLIYTEPTDGGVPPEHRWLVHDQAVVVSRGATAAAALDQYILQVLSTGLPLEEKTRELRRRRLEEANIMPQRFIGLLPLSLRLLREDALGTLRADTTSLTEYTELVMLRTLLRRTLSEMRLTAPFGGGAANQRDIAMPEPTSPSSVDELCWFVKNMTALTERGVPQSKFDGHDQTNAASFIITRHEIDSQLNREVDPLARLVMREILNAPGGWSAEAIQPEVRIGGTFEPVDPGIMLSVDERYRDMLNMLRSIRATLFEPTTTIGLLQTGSGERGGESFDKFSRLLSNRRWLRYIALALVSTALITELARTINENQFPMNIALRRVLVLFCLTAYYNMQSSGIKLQSTPSITALYQLLQTNRASLLPLDSLPARIEAIVRTGSISQRSPLGMLLTDSGYEWYLWLLRAAADASLAGFTVPPLTPLTIDAPPTSTMAYDDLSVAYDAQARFVTLLRTTLFRMPAPDADFSVTRELYYEQSAGEPTRIAIATHFHENAATFVERAVAEQFVADRNEALAWVDLLAFDQRYALNSAEQEWQIAALDINTHMYDDLRPRFVERAALSGYDVLRRRVFGALHVMPDARQPITNNIDRVPLPSRPGDWRSTRPRVTPEHQLCVKPLSALVPFVDPRRGPVQRVVQTNTDGYQDDETPLKRARRAAPAPPPPRVRRHDWMSLDA